MNRRVLQLLPVLHVKHFVFSILGCFEAILMDTNDPARLFDMLHDSSVVETRTFNAIAPPSVYKYTKKVIFHEKKTILTISPSVAWFSRKLQFRKRTIFANVTVTAPPSAATLYVKLHLKNSTLIFEYNNLCLWIETKILFLKNILFDLNQFELLHQQHYFIGEKKNWQNSKKNTFEMFITKLDCR